MLFGIIIISRLANQKKLVSNHFDKRLMVSTEFLTRMSNIDGSSFVNGRICSISLPFMIADVEFWGFGLLIGQKTALEWCHLSSGKV